MTNNKIRGNYSYENAKKALRALAKANGHKLQNFRQGFDETYCQLCQKCARIGGENKLINLPCPSAHVASRTN